MPAILRKSLTAWEALAAHPPTPRKNSRPPRDRVDAIADATASTAAGSNAPQIFAASDRKSLLNDMGEPSGSK